jgi:hypothetical protein
MLFSLNFYNHKAKVCPLGHDLVFLNTHPPNYQNHVTPRIFIFKQERQESFMIFFFHNIRSTSTATFAIKISPS